MKNIKLILILMACMLSTAIVSAQDIIIKKNGDKLKVFVKEINDTQIKYVEFDDPNEILFTINRALIKEIKFSYGKRYKEEAPTEVADYFAQDGNNNIMFNFLAFGNDAVILSYERAINAGASFEITGKILGLGIDDNGNSYKKTGFGIDLAYKLKFGSVFKKAGEYRPKHLMHGGYFRPIAGFAYAEEDTGHSSSKYSYGHFGLQIGKQWIIQDKISLDLYFGFHYYVGDEEQTNVGGVDTPRTANFNDGDLGGADNRAFGYGFKVGYLFGTYGFKDQKKKR